MILKIIFGLIGLGLVVFVHELGHFIAARLVGIDVEAFSIGWGRPLLKKTIGKVEYRIGVFPIGGYCRMRGEAEFREALTKEKTEIPRDSGTFYGATPLRRIIVALSGPGANVVFAVAVLSIVWGIGFDVRAQDNRIILASELEASATYPADQSGLMTGDRIVAIDGKNVKTSLDVQESVSTQPNRVLSLTVDRNGERKTLPITPKMDSATGAGKIGIYFWTDPVVETVAPESPSAVAGVRPGDTIRTANGKPVPHTISLIDILKDRPSVLTLDLDRNGAPAAAELVLSYGDEGAVDLGIGFKTIRYRTPTLSLPQALAKGSSEALNTMAISVRSFGLLFKGVDLTRAVSGPVRITYMVGDVAAESFGQGFGAGLSSVMSFLALISLALCIMNLLPIPALDGGLTILFLIELIMRRPLHPKAIYIFQMIGTFIILGLLLFSIFGDILFLFGRN